MYLGVLLTLLATLNVAWGHGRLHEPPSRASMWRFGYKTQQNYNDNQLFCGGVETQYTTNGGKCGVCGDPWNGARDHEPGGKYYSGLIARNYKAGQVFNTSVDVTANHKGWFQFKLCVNDIPDKKVDQACFDRHLLPNIYGETTIKIGEMPGIYNHTLRLPAGVTCRACVLQWRYHAGNSWGVDPGAKEGCMGCGNQEEFYGCSDIAIGHPELILAKPNGPQNIPGPSGPGNEKPADWIKEQEQVKEQLKGCNCPCATGSALVVLPIPKMALFLPCAILSMFGILF